MDRNFLKRTYKIYIYNSTNIMSESQYESELCQSRSMRVNIYCFPAVTGLVLIYAPLTSPQSWDNVPVEELPLFHSTGHYARPSDLRPTCEELTQLQITGVPQAERRTSQTVRAAPRRGV